MPERNVTVIGAPLDLGAGRRGVDMGPSAFRVADLHQAIRGLGHNVEDAGDVPVAIAERHDPGDPKLKYLREIRATCEALRDTVAATLARGRFPLVLGGDHSIAMGTIAGLARHHHARGERIGLFSYNHTGEAGYADFDSFTYRYDSPQTG